MALPKSSEASRTSNVVGTNSADKLQDRDIKLGLCNIPNTQNDV